MKTSIKLTDEQIDQLVAAEQKILTEEKEKAIKAIEEKYIADVTKLKLKYVTMDIEINPTPKKERVRFDEEQLKKLVEEKKSVKTIAAIIGKSENSIRAKLYHMGIKLRKQ